MVRAGAKLNCAVKGEGKVCLVKLPERKFLEHEISVLKQIRSNRGMPGVVVALERDVNELSAALKRSDVRQDDIIFIFSNSGRPVRQDNILSMGKLDSLTDMAIAIDEALFSLTANRKFLLFDSVDKILKTHGEDETAGFFKFLTDSLKEKRVTGIIFTVGTHAKGAWMESLREFCENRDGGKKL